MKIYILSRKVLTLISLVTTVLLLLFFIISPSSSIAIELSKSSIISDATINEIASLSHNSEKVAYLTFDDGPTESVTPKILDILKEENVKATFFVIGKYVEHHPDIVKRCFDEGHFIANHGYDHNNKTLYRNDSSFISEIQKTDYAIGKAIGIEDYCSHVFRFPNGFMSPNNKTQKKHATKLLSEMNYTYVDWNCLTKDSERKLSKNQLLSNLKKSAKNKGTLIVLMHDTKDVNDSSLVLKDSIDYLRSQDYTFKTFYEFN